MILRCRNPNRRDFKWYGARGVQVCPEWLTPPVGTGGFSQFLLDLGPRPAGTTLDRIDVDGHYEPSNCRWATRDVQANNRHDPEFTELYGHEMDEWAEEARLEPKWTGLVVVVACSEAEPDDIPF
jgi:hypothetical protein